MKHIQVRKVYHLHSRIDADIKMSLILLEGELKALKQLYPLSEIKFYLTPGAYFRLINIVDGLPNTEFVRTSTENIGTLLGCPCLCTVFSSPKNFYSMPEYSFSYQVEENF